jgi:hypothetical protein
LVTHQGLPRSNQEQIFLLSVYGTGTGSYRKTMGKTLGCKITAGSSHPSLSSPGTLYETAVFLGEDEAPSKGLQ